MAGLLGISKPPKYRVAQLDEKGRGVILMEAVKEGAFVVEYEATVYPRKERAAREKEYCSNGEGCFIIDVQTPSGWVCFDATRSFHSPGRLMNHAPRFAATVVPFKPLLLDGKWRLGFTATRDLSPGEELMWDYGCTPGGIEWLKRRPKVSTTGEYELSASCTLYPCVCVHC